MDARTRKSRSRWTLCALTSAALTASAGCADDVASGATVESTVYGIDDRLDLYAEPDPRLRALAASSSVVIVPSLIVNDGNPADVRFRAPTLGIERDLCADQRFRNDPTGGVCSGTLIDDDLVLTAGHCIPNAVACAAMKLVFNFYRSSATAVHAIRSDDVFDCDRIVAHAQRDGSEGHIDYSVVRLARRATPRFQPATLYRGRESLPAGAPLACIGYPGGIPVKIDSGGRVLDPRASVGDYFLASTDTFTFSSGSGVYDPTTFALRGFLLDGNSDYDRNGLCFVVHRCAATGCAGESMPGESVAYVRHALDGLCAALPASRACVNADAGMASDGGGVSDAGTAGDGGDAGRALDARAAEDGALGDARSDRDARALRSDGEADTGADAGADAGAGAGAGAGGCGCRVGSVARSGLGARRAGPGIVMVATALLVAASRRRRRREGEEVNSVPVRSVEKVKR